MPTGWSKSAGPPWRGQPVVADALRLRADSPPDEKWKFRLRALRASVVQSSLEHSSHADYEEGRLPRFQIHSVTVAGFLIMDNHLHVLVRSEDNSYRWIERIQKEASERCS